MSTSFIYHAHGLQCYDYIRQDFAAGTSSNLVKQEADIYGALTRAPVTS